MTAVCAFRPKTRVASGRTLAIRVEKRNNQPE
jgi:hypothetical protein